MTVKHLDLFSGIGGFAYALDQLLDDVEHVFCDYEPFAQQVLKKHWPEAKIYGNIKEINTNPFNTGLEGRRKKQSPGQRGQPDRAGQDQESRPFILTGGFPCQPFSAAGVRRGTSDERYLWPEMLRVIRLTKPEWVIAENVSGLLTWEKGVVFEQVCADLEDNGYTVQPFIIPAAAVGAPHRRDRIWFVAYSGSGGQPGPEASNQQQGRAETVRPSKNAQYGSEGLAATNTTGQGLQKRQPSINTEASKEAGRGPDNRLKRAYSDVENSERQRSRGRSHGNAGWSERQIQDAGPGWERYWTEIAAELCRVDDGLPAELDGFKLSKSKHREEQLKAYGNAIVPQVAIEIMRGILL